MKERPRSSSDEVTQARQRAGQGLCVWKRVPSRKRVDYRDSMKGSSTAVSQSSRSFPLPATFSEGLWKWDRMHYPQPVTPLTQEIVLPGVSRGFTDAMAALSCPIGLNYRVANYYAYMSVVPQHPDDESFDNRMERYQQIIEDVLPRLGTSWAEDWLPSILPNLDRVRALNFGVLGDQALLGELDRMRTEFYERYRVHGWINFVTLSASLFADFYNETFSPENPTEPYHMLQGYPTRSLDAGRALWALREAVLASDVLLKEFEETEPSSIVAALEGSEEGQAFLPDFWTYLDEFGWRSDVFELAHPTWREDPTIPLNLLRGYVRVGEEEDPSRRFDEAVAQRESLLALARQRLAGDAERLRQFEVLHEVGKHYLTLTEDHNFYIDQIGNAVIRLPVLELGRRLTDRGVIADRGDVFYLHLDEIRGALDGDDVKERVSDRKEQIAFWAQVIPPSVVGESPQPSGDPFEEAVQKMFGVPVEPSSDPSVVTGIGASQGTARGPVKVVRSLIEASKLEPGDVLVCEVTMPPWTPLFSTVSAVVADTGGLLSHCAIACREYGLPSVVGTQVGTAVLQDGMTVTVDGSQGLVRVDGMFT